jgi:hypothetical protein
VYRLERKGNSRLCRTSRKGRQRATAIDVVI